MTSEPCPGCGSYETGPEEEVDSIKLVCYGGDGPCFSRRCHCGRFLRMPETVKWNDAGDTDATGHCSHCGDVQLPVFCRADD